MHPFVEYIIINKNDLWTSISKVGHILMVDHGTNQISKTL